MATRPVALLTDFGTRDWYVAALKGVILSRAPHAAIIDITHEIPPQDVTAGAFTLAAALPWLPLATVVVAVVDPGVGTRRALLAAQADGRFLLGPDNGLLDGVLAKAKTRTVMRLTNRRYWLRTISRTFQGRDILAPVAAHLARGGALRVLGTPVGGAIVPMPLPSPCVTGRSVRGAVVHIDAFGNLVTNLPGGLVAASGPRGGGLVYYKQRRVRVVSSYGDAPPGQLVAVVGSLGLIELAVHAGSAARHVAARRGDRVEWVR